MALWRAALLFIVSAIACVHCAIVAPPPVVDLGYAKYQGVYNASGNSSYFLGIRFAAPPTGKLRFQAPTAPDTMTGLQLANSEPASCYQNLPSTSASQDPNADPSEKRQLLPPVPQLIQSEDCLFMNIWTPGHFDPNASYPVVIWIYGGGYTWGTMSLYNGNDLVTDSLSGAIAITFQYRLGVFGFLAGSEVKTQGAMNAALLDQKFAFEWVQKYIHLFGGDPTKVTIWGESSGAGSVLQHIVANGGNLQPPLFRAAITSSTYVPPQFDGDDKVPNDVYNAVVTSTGCGSAANNFTCLQEIESDILNTVAQAVYSSGYFGTFIFGPVVDGTYIVERPFETLGKGKVNGEKYFATTNQDEGFFFTVPFSTDTTLNVYVENLLPNLNASDVQKLVNVYEALNLPSVQDTEAVLIGDGLFKCPTYFIMEAFPGNSYKGLFAIPPAFHGEELEYYFDGLRLFNNVQFEASFSQSFLNFVKTLNPNDHDNPDNITPLWNVWSDGDTEMLFNETTAGQPDIRPITSDSGLSARCQIWRDLAAIIPQ